VRRHFGYGPVKGVVETSKMHGRGEDRLRGGDKRQSLWDVQRREMSSVAKLPQNLRRQELVCSEFWPSVHDAMANRRWSALNLILHFGGDNRKRLGLRFVDGSADHERSAVGREDMQGAIIVSNTFRATGQQRSFIAVARAPIIETELERRRAAVEDEN